MDAETKPIYAIGIVLLNTLVSKKYCVYKKIARQQYFETYLARNIHDNNDYAVYYYKLWQLSNQIEKNALKNRVLKKAQIFSKVKSPYVRRCFDVYLNQSCIVVVYQNLPSQSLAQELNADKIARESFPRIRDHMFEAISAIHEAGYLVKLVEVDKVYYKNGSYKIKDFKMFSSQFENLQKQLAPGLVSGGQVKNLKKSDVWALGLFYLKTIFWHHSLPLLPHFQCIFTKQMESQLENDDSFNRNQIIFLKNSLMVDQKSRQNWYEIKNVISKSSQECQEWLIQKQKLQIVNYLWENKQEEVGKKLVIFEDDKSETDDDKLNMQLRIQKFQFIGLEKDDVEIYKQITVPNCDQQYRIYEECYFEIQKSEYIQNRILNQIQKNKLLNLQKRFYIEFMYLVSARCLTDFSTANQKIKLAIHSGTPVIYDLHNKYQNHVAPLEKNHNELFNKYSKLLTSSQSKPFSIMFDAIKTFVDKEQRKSADKFLTGVEKIDYSRQQQIDFTCKLYLPLIIERLKKSDNLIAKNVIGNLKIYSTLLQLNKSQQKRGAVLSKQAARLLMQANEKQGN